MAKTRDGEGGDSPPGHKGPDGILTVSEVADVLHIHVNTVRAWSNNGMLASYRIGRRGDRRFLMKDVHRFLERGRILELL